MSISDSVKKSLNFMCSMPYLSNIQIPNGSSLSAVLPTPESEPCVVVEGDVSPDVDCQ